jgi:serine phosphatase RsbU (regulator of sigma subunit)
MNLALILLEMYQLLGNDHLPEAETLLLEVIELADRSVADKSWPCFWLSMVYTFQGRYQQARQFIDMAKQAIEHPTFWDEKNMALVEAHLAAAEKRWQEAFSHYEAAIAILARKSLRLEWARTLQEWAGAHIARGEPADYERAKALYREALTLYEEMGTTFYIDLVTDQLQAARAKTYATALDHQKVSQEMAQAGRIQASFLPEQIPDIHGWQISASLHPARETSGDFFDFIPLPGDLLGIVIADVADKGMAAALYMTTCHTLIRTFASEHPKEPELVLSKTNQRILSDTHGGLFITVFYGVLDPDKAVLTYCNAGHNPPYLLSPSSEGKPQALTRTGMPLGIIEQTSWEQGIMKFNPGDVLIAYTDGVTEAQNMEEEFYGEVGLIAAARTNVAHSAEAMQQRLVKDIQQFVGAAPQFDDMTLLVLKRE